jgi:hypothetical protein
VWEHVTDDGQLTAIAASAKQVFAAGRVTQADGTTDLLIRALSAKTGALNWADQFDQGLTDIATDVASDNDTVSVAGLVTDPLNNSAFFVRTYVGSR